MKKRNWGAIVVLVFCILAVERNAIAGLPESIAALLNDDKYSTAVNEIKLAADQGNSDAQFFLGRMYEHAYRVDKNMEAAFKWYQLAANQGNKPAVERLSRAYVEGAGTAKDPKAAMQWFQAAGNAGNADAQYKVATMYSSGEGVPKNNALAMQWTRRSADGRNALAINDLGLAYQNGSGVNINKVLAFALYNTSALYDASDKNRANLNRLAIAKDMTESEIDSAVNLSCALKNAKSLIATMDLYTANPKGISDNACASNPAQ